MFPCSESASAQFGQGLCPEPLQSEQTFWRFPRPLQVGQITFAVDLHRLQSRAWIFVPAFGSSVEFLSWDNATFGIPIQKIRHKNPVRIWEVLIRIKGFNTCFFPKYLF